MPIDESQGFHFHIPNLDKLIHVILFAGFGYLWMQSGRLSRGCALAIVCAGLALTIVTELGQGTEFVGRDATLEDGLADVVGLSLAVGGTLYWAHRREADASRIRPS